MAQVAIAWSISKPGVTAPIVGTTSLKNLEDIIGMSYQYDGLYCKTQIYLGAVDVQLTEEEIKYLEEPYQPTATAGHM